ncbi:caspase family protein [Streptomyces sp. NPDC001177]
MTGYSLHIGLNQVDAAAYGGWNGQLSGCVNDALAMQRLADATGYRSMILLDAQATSQAVIGEIARLARQAVHGDICLISYSGHGGQVDDLNGDENDNLDETWVCYDRQVVDDELAQMWSQFEPGVRVVVVSDSCHSGTVARDRTVREMRRALLDAHARDAAPSALAEIAPAETVITQGAPKAMPLEFWLADNAARRGTYQFVQALSGPHTACNTSAQVILLAGCQDNQLSYDGSVNGQFTGALLQVWNVGAYTGDYRNFVTAIGRLLLPDQTPNLDTVGNVDAAFLSQRPFTISSGTGSSSSSSGGGGGTSVEPSARPTLRRGAAGEHVRYLQARLLAAGYTVSVDGVFGPATEMTVRSFQRSQGLTADGVVGPNTWAALG